MYARVGQETGREWWDALQLHTSNQAFWTYPHDSAAHFEDDALSNGPSICVDDSVLESGNRYCRAVGKKVFQGGSSHGGTVGDGGDNPFHVGGAVGDTPNSSSEHARAVFEQPRDCYILDSAGKKTGELERRIVKRAANFGRAQQVLWMSAVSQECAKTRTPKKTKAQITTERERHATMQAKRGRTVDQLELKVQSFDIT